MWIFLVQILEKRVAVIPSPLVLLRDTNMEEIKNYAWSIGKEIVIL